MDYRLAELFEGRLHELGVLIQNYLQISISFFDVSQY